MKKYEDICIGSDTSILAALKQMDATHRKLLIITKDGQYHNLLSIGDIQRAILKGVDLNNSNSLKEIFNHNIVSILKEYTRGRDKDAVNDLIQKCADALEVTYVL